MRPGCSTGPRWSWLSRSLTAATTHLQAEEFLTKFVPLPSRLAQSEIVKICKNESAHEILRLIFHWRLTATKVTLSKLIGRHESDTYIFIRKTAPSSARVTFPPVGIVNSLPICPKERVLWIDIIHANPGMKSGVLHLIGEKCCEKLWQDKF